MNRQVTKMILMTLSMIFVMLLILSVSMGAANEKFADVTDNENAVSGIPGDINSDNLVNTKDLLRARKYFAGWKVEADLIALDANGDKTINTKDLLRLRKFFAGWDVEIWYGDISNKTHTHIYSEWKSVNDISHERSCNCGDKQIGAHAWDSGTVSKEPTHTEFGEKTFTCTICHTTKTEKIEMSAAHAFGEWIYSDINVHKRVCPCGMEDADSHVWDDGVAIDDADGVKNNIKYTCIVCGGTKIGNASEAEYTVTFVDYDYAVISSQVVKAGESAIPPTNPIRKNYKFKGWSGDYNNISNNVTIRATYVRVFTVTFVDRNNSHVKVYNDVEIGTDYDDLLDIPAVPAIKGYSGAWNGQYTNISENKMISPIYTANKYKVSFEMPNGDLIPYIDANGTAHDFQEIEYGSFAVEPEHPEYVFLWNEYRGYGFTGWSREFNRITEDTKVTAVFDSDYDKPIIAIKYKDKNGELSPSITLCNLSTVRLYGISFAIRFATNSLSYSIAVDEVVFNTAMDWLMSDGQKLYDCEINNKTKELNFAWSNGNGVKIDTYGDFIVGMIVKTGGGAELAFADLFKLSESECSLIISRDEGATFEKVTPIVVCN